MDVLAGLLTGPNADGAFVLTSVLEPPWSLRIEDRAPLSVVAVVRGDAWVCPDGGESVRLTPGDVLLARGPDGYLVADDPATPASVRIGPGQVCSTVDGRSLGSSMDLGLRTWGNGRDGRDLLITGTYQTDSAVGARLLDALPQIVVVRGEPATRPLVAVLVEEAARDLPGQGVLLDRLVDLLVISTVREWFASPDATTPAWYRAYADRVLGPALRAVHADPGAAWTVESLARECGLSRAAFARRFGEMVGEAPMAYLTELRIALAADLLRDPDTTVAAVARRVGYGSPFALSAAFKRLRGVSPAAHRASA